MTPANAAPVALVEPFAGMAALSFGCMGAVPPISWMGSKRGYTRVLMELLGLSRHNPPAAYIWGDVGPNVAALATLAGARGDARDVAGWLVGTGWSTQSKGDLYMGPDRVSKGHEPGSTRSVTLDGIRHAAQALPLPRAAEVAAIIRSWKDEEPRALWTRLKAAGWPSLMPPKGARWGQPIVGRWLGPARVEEVAGWLMSQQMQHPGTEMFSASKVEAQFGGANGHGRLNRSPITPKKVADMTVALPARWPRVACYQGTATRLVGQLPADLSGFLVYADGPYHGDGSRKITGYKFGGCSREEQLALVADCHRRGARVAMSESVPLAAELQALTGDEWWPVDITEHREGQARTFGGTSEYVTLNRPPLHMRGTQQGLFGGAR